MNNEEYRKEGSKADGGRASARGELPDWEAPDWKVVARDRGPRKVHGDPLAEGRRAPSTKASNDNIEGRYRDPWGVFGLGAFLPASVSKEDWTELVEDTVSSISRVNAELQDALAERSVVGRIVDAGNRWIARGQEQARNALDALSGGEAEEEPKRLGKRILAGESVGVMTLRCDVCGCVHTRSRAGRLGLCAECGSASHERVA